MEANDPPKRYKKRILINFKFLIIIIICLNEDNNNWIV